MHALFAKFGNDTRGTFAIMTALLFVIVMGSAAFGVDVGKIFLDRRTAQGTTDLAALSAASNLTAAKAAAQATVEHNRFPGTTPLNVELGVYTANAALTPAQRFAPSGTATANAVRVTLKTKTPLYFGRVLTGTDNFDITTVATATNTALATFAIGSRLASINGGLLNQVLGGMLGTSLSLTAMDYQSLLDAKLDMFDVMNALVTRAHLTAATYSDILNSSVNASDVASAFADAAKSAYGANNAAASALSSIARDVPAAKIQLGSLIDAGPYDSTLAGQKPQAGAAVSAFDMLSAMAQIANGQHQVAATLNLGIPGIAAASLALSVGERPVGSSAVTIGSQGASVHTAQTRLLLTVQLVGTGSIAAVNLPIYVEVASGTATLNAVTCGSPNVSASTVTLGVQPGIVDAWIGDVSSSDMANFRTAPSPGAATLVNLALLKIKGRAHATMGNTTAQPVSFSYSDITAQTKKTVSTTNFTSSLLSKLVGDLSLNVNVLGLGLGLPSNSGQIVSGLISNVAAPLDQTLAGILGALGVGLGQADVWVSNIRCDGAVLVN